MDTLLATDAPPSDLDVALGDRTTVPELDAWGAFQALRSDSPDLDRPLDDAGRTARAIAREKLTSYTAERRQYGRPLFPNIATQENRKRAEYHRGLFTKPLADVLDPEAMAKIDTRAKLASDPDRYRARAVLKIYLSDLTGGPIPPENFDQVRSLYARQHLGLKDDTSDKAVFSALRDRYAEEETTDGTIEDASRQVFSATLSGTAPDPRKAWEAVAPNVPERLRPAAREEFLANAREARRVKRKLEPGVTKAEKSLRALRDTGIETGTGETGLGFLWDEAAAALPDNPQERGLALAMLSERMKGWGEDERATFARAGDAIGRGFRQAGRGFFDAARATGEQVAESIAPDSEQARMRQRAGVMNEKVRALQSLQYAEAGALVKTSDSFLQRGTILAAQSAWTLPATLTGAGGVAALSLSFGGSRYTEARLANPDADKGAQLNAAMASGMVEAQIERGMNALGMKALKGKLPGVAGMLNKFGVRSPLGRAAIGGSAAFLATGATEYTEEALQEATNRALQDIALELSGITPTTDWGQFLSDWSTVAGQEQEDTLAAVIPFALIGGGGASFSHFHYGDYLRKNATLLRAVGVPEARVEEIVSTPDVAKADDALREAFAGGLESRSAQQRADAVAVLEEQAKLLEAAGFPVVTEEANSFTEETDHIFSAPDGTRETFATREEALDAWRGWTLQQSEEDLDTLTRAANEEVADFLTGEGMASEGTLVEAKDSALTPAEAVRRGYATPEQMKARLEIFALQEGRQAQAEDLRLFARRFSEIARDGTYRGVVQYFRGADPLNIIEDLAEDTWNRGLDGGALTGAELVGYIRQTEESTGQRYLADGYTYTDGQRMPLLEALSKVSTEYVIGNAKAESLPERFRAWLDMIVAVAAATFRHAGTLARSGNLMAAVKAGKIDAKFERMVADSVGLNPEAIERRVTQEYQKQLAAEAMGGFREIGEFLQGQLPHPETMRKAQGPLAGELRRIWDEMKTPTKRRRKDGSQVDDVQRANAFFLPIGEQADLDEIRERANEKGFDFSTPADMLDALETSILYGRPVYGTKTPETIESSFSVGRSTVTPSAETRTFQGAEGSPSVIGPASFSISAHHGTPNKVDRFRMDRIGTGEGAQVQGWGLYFATLKDVALSYTSAGVDAKLADDTAGNLYTVRLMIEEEQLLDWDRPLADQPAPVLAALRAAFGDRIQQWDDTAGEWYQEQANPWGGPLTVDPATMSEQLLAAGIRGIRYLDGDSRAQGEGTANFVIFSEADIEIAEENGQPVTLAGSFSISTKGIQRLEAAIAKKLTAAPEERADFYQRLRDRLAGLTQRLEDMDAGRGPFARKATDEAGEERRRIRDAYAEARAIVDTLPAEARGRVSINLDDITSPTTERGRINALVRLIEQADDALETVLKREYLEAFETLLDLAKPDLRESKALRGRLTPETQRLVGKVQDAVELDAVKAALRIHNQQLALQELSDRTPATPEESAALEAELAEAVEALEILETFSALGSRTAAELSAALEQLTAIYTRGRTARRILDESRRKDLEDQKREVLASLPRPTQATHSKRTADKGLGDLAESFRLGLSSFHQVMEALFPNSATARDFQDRIRKADREFTRAKIDARDRFNSFMRTAFDLSGISAKRHANRILAAISKRRDDWNIEIREGTRMEPVKLSPEQAQAILAGTLKPGWEGDPIAIESLRQAYADFRLARTRDQSRAKFVRFSRLTSRGTPSFLDLSDLEAVYLLQLHAQEQYRPALDRYGFTAEIIERIRAKVDPRALEIAGYLRQEYAAEYDRLNPTFRALFGMDMPRIRNYAPGLFENLDTKGEASQLDPYGNPATPVNAMSAGFTKSRTHHMARPRQTNALAAYWSHLEATEYFIAYAETMRDARLIFRNPDVRRAIENANGTRTASVFSTWLDALEVDGRFRSSNMLALQELTTRTLATQSAIGLAYNVGTLFKQASAAFGVFMEMPTTAAISGIMKTLASPGTLRHVWKQEAIQQRILAGMSPEDRRMIDAAEASPSILMELLEVGRLPIALADATFTTASAAIAYNYHRAAAIKAGMSESRAEEVALQALDRIVTRTAQPATTQDKSIAEVTAQGFGRFLFLFKSDPRQKLAISLAALRGVFTGEVTKAEAARRLFWGWAFYGIMAELMTDLWQGMSRRDDDEERWAVSDYVAAAIVGPISGIPLLGAGIELAIRSSVGTKAYSNSANPIDNAVGRIFKDGFTSATWRVATAEDQATLEQYLNAALGDASALAQIAGAIDPRAAIVPAGLRLARDTAGILGNAAELATGESEEDRARKIIEQERKADSTATKARTEATKATAKQLEEMPAEQRERQLATMDRASREAIEARLRRRELTETERGLASLSAPRRAAAIARILETMPQDKREPFLDRLRAVRILTRETEAALPTPTQQTE